MAKICLILYCLLGCLSALKAQKYLSARDVIHLTRQHSPRLRVAAFEVPVAATEIQTAGLRPNPSLNLQPLQLIQPAAFEEGTRFWQGANRQLWFQLTKEFQTAQKRERKIELARAQADMAPILLREEERQVLYEACMLWADLWLHRVNIRFIEQMEANIDTLVHINRVRVRNEALLESELIRTQLIAEEYAFQKRNALQSFHLSMRRLQFLVGAKDSLDVREGLFFDLIDFVESPDSLHAQALRYRTDLLAAQTGLPVAAADLRLQQALAKPNIEAGLIYNPQNTVPYMGLYANIPLPVYDRNQGNIQKAVIRKDQTQQYIRLLEDQIAQEVHNAFRDYQNQQLNVVQTANILSKSQAVLSTVRYSYLKGNTNIIDFLEAQRTLYQTQLNANVALYNLKRSYLSLLYTTGIILNIP